MSWFPFYRSDMIVLKTNYEQTLNDEHILTITCEQSHVGDPYRFCIKKDTPYIWVATPYHDDCVPVYPKYNDNEETRIKEVKITVPSLDLAKEVFHGIVADLDEYIRSKKALEHLPVIYEYVI